MYLNMRCRLQFKSRGGSLGLLGVTTMLRDATCQTLPNVNAKTNAITKVLRIILEDILRLAIRKNIKR
jgi:hypothetical protein